VALLPDALFFTRSIPITAGATSAEAAAQVELALEAMSPFPLAQLYYGWFWKPGADHAFVFAAYRRRFTSEQTAEWENAELVVPAFCAVFGAEVSPATTIVLNAIESVTAVHWESSPVPTKVLVRTLEPETPEDARAKVREEILNAIGGSKTILDVESPLLPESTDSDSEVAFRSGDLASTLPTATTVSLDVRDKADLAALRAGRKRDVLLWRVTLGCVAALVLLALGEFALVGGAQWQKVRKAKIAAQKQPVERIMASQALANRIDELATKRMLPFEMITAMIVEKRLPPAILFKRVTASPQTGIYTLTVQAVSTDVGQVGAYVATLQNLPFIQRVDLRDENTRNGVESFTLVVTFKPETLKPADTISE
jgi:hypothetical protein